MNISKISLPPLPLINFYYYYSNFSLLLTWITTPLLLYIILTQSKKLKEYKWFILNHLFWCLAFETLIGSVKPLLLLPAMAGFPLSLIRESKNIFITAIATMIGLICCLNYVIGISATIISRYLTVFPSPLTTCLTTKVIVLIAFLFSVTLSTVILAFLIPQFFSNIDSMHNASINYDQFFIEFTESSMVFVDPEKVRYFVLGFFGLIIIIIIVTIFVIFIFIYLVQNSKAATKIQKSLIISSAAQILITLFLLFIPLAVIITCVGFQIPNTSEVGCICFSITSFHGILEFLATMYFVLPYRRYLKKQMQKFPVIILKSSNVHRNSVR